MMKTNQLIKQNSNQFAKLSYLGTIQVSWRFQIYAEAVFFRFIGARRTSVASKKPAPFVGALGFVVLLWLRWWTRHVIRRIVRLMICPILRMWIAIRSSGTIVALPIHSALCNEISLLLVSLCTTSEDRMYYRE